VRLAFDAIRAAVFINPTSVRSDVAASFRLRRANAKLAPFTALVREPS